MAQRLPAMCNVRGESRRGTTTAETLIAIVVLGVAASAVGKFASTMATGLDDRELSAKIGWEIANAREVIGSWPAQEITEERIESLAVELSEWENGTDAQWVAAVSKISEPAQAVQVELGLRCKIDGQWAEPERLTFWVADADSKQVTGDRTEEGKSTTRVEQANDDPPANTEEDNA